MSAGVDPWKQWWEQGERCWCGCDRFRVVMRQEGAGRVSMHLRCERCDACRRVTTPNAACHVYGVTPEFAPREQQVATPAPPVGAS